MQNWEHGSVWMQVVDLAYSNYSWWYYIEYLISIFLALKKNSVTKLHLQSYFSCLAQYICVYYRPSAFSWGYFHPKQVNSIEIIDVYYSLIITLTRKQIKRSRVDFKCGICIWNLLLLTFNIKSKELSLPVKRSVIRLKSPTDSRKVRCGQSNYLVHSW